MNALEAALYARLTGGTALTTLLSGTTSVYNQMVPTTETGDCVVFGLTGGGDENLCPQRSQALLYSVKGVSEVSAAKAGTIDAQVDALLHRATLTVTGWANILLRRESEFSFTEKTPEGRHYYHRGGVYRIHLWQNT